MTGRPPKIGWNTRGRPSEKSGPQPFAKRREKGWATRVFKDLLFFFWCVHPPWAFRYL